MTTKAYMAKLLDDALRLHPIPGIEAPPRNARGQFAIWLWSPPTIYPPDLPEGPSGSPQALAAANLRLYEYHRSTL